MVLRLMIVGLCTRHVASWETNLRGKQTPFDEFQFKEQGTGLKMALL